VRLHPFFTVCCTLLVTWGTASAEPDLVDKLLARYTSAKAAAGPDALHLLFLARTEHDARSESYYYRYAPGKGWKALDTFDGHSDLAVFGGALYVFRPDNYTVYSEDDWRPAEWPLSWAPSAACGVGEQLWVFGSRSVAGKHRVRLVTFDAPKKDEIARAPVEHPLRLELPKRAYDICAVTEGRAARVLWHQQAAAAGANEVWMATCDGERWSEPTQVPVPYAHSDFAAAVHEGKLWVFCKERGHGITAERPLRFITWQSGQWDADGGVVSDATDAHMDWTFDIDAEAFGDTLFVFRACRHSVMAHPWRGGQWLPPDVVLRVPPWASYVVWWTLANGLACLALLPVVTWLAYRVRRQQKQAVFPDGRTLTVATWSRRVAALLLDFFITEFIWLGVAMIVSVGEGEGTQELADLPAMVALHVVVYFAYFFFGESVSGQTVGKRLLSIAVISHTGTRASRRSILIRNLLRPWLPLVPVAYVVGSIVLFATSARQRVGDLLAGTIVVDVPRAHAPRTR